MGGINAGLVVAMLAAAAPAQGQFGRDVLIRIGAPVRIEPSQLAGSVFVINDDVVIEGRAIGDVVVVNGRARVTGSIDGSVVAVNGQVDLASSARVDGDLLLYRSTMARAPGAVIAGETEAESALTVGRRFLGLVWVALTVALTVAAVLFAAIGGGLLDRAVTALRHAPAVGVVGAVATFVGLPIVAVLAFLTVAGSAVGFGIVAVVLPALWLLGYLVSSTALGRLLLPVLRARDTPGRPYAAATIGLITAQVIGLIPFVGGLFVVVAGAMGGGVLVSLAWSRWRHPGPELAPGAA